MDPDPDFSRSDPDFWPILVCIRTQKKNADPNPGKKTGSETLILQNKLHWLKSQILPSKKLFIVKFESVWHSQKRAQTTINIVQ